MDTFTSRKTKSRSSELISLKFESGAPYRVSNRPSHIDHKYRHRRSFWQPSQQGTLRLYGFDRPQVRGVAPDNAKPAASLSSDNVAWTARMAAMLSQIAFSGCANVSGRSRPYLRSEPAGFALSRSFEEDSPTSERSRALSNAEALNRRSDLSAVRRLCHLPWAYWA